MHKKLLTKRVGRNMMVSGITFVVLGIAVAQIAVFALYGKVNECLDSGCSINSENFIVHGGIAVVIVGSVMALGGLLIFVRKK